MYVSVLFRGVVVIIRNFSKASGSGKAACTEGSHRTGSSPTRGPLNG